MAACAQVTGPLSTFYWWEEQFETATEWYCFLKTTVELYPALEHRLKALHSYDTPEVIAVPVTHSSAKYANWVMESVRSGNRQQPSPSQEQR